ncbi:MAG: relaxase/mobilization nuclease domain-containing protein [Chitinophagaceae bacterium]|nr:relaxase/mobilization nuclease domain-containing protein [Chitinophagaceae bacterium]
MVAKITIPNSIRRALNYNEQKMKEGKAECIYAHHFLKEAKQLNFYEKLRRFQLLIDLNKRATTNTIHISLNFGLVEKIGREKLVGVATAYMEKIGFGEQPYLVYQHLDAGHPHIHIVSTNIQTNGKRISLHNIGRNQSNTARKELEIFFNLQKAEEHEKLTSEEIRPITAQKLTYGKSATKRGITNVLDAVLPRYKYASLTELNAILKLYNLTADRGKEQGIIYQKRGLVYRVLDEKGNKIGVPIKASSIYSKPTLNYLEKKFSENEILKQKFRKNIKTSIDWILIKSPKTLQAFKLALEKEKISLVVRQNDSGIVYGLTYIDHNTKCVFNGSDIGKEYSAKAILEKCGVEQYFGLFEKPVDLKISARNSMELSLGTNKEQSRALPNLLEVITASSDELQYVPYELRKKTKKKRKFNG